MNNEDQFDRVTQHLANERTYLAWLRTGLATMGFGVLLAKLRYIIGVQPTPSLIRASDIGLIFSVVGLLITGCCAQRFFSVQKQIEQQIYLPSNLLVRMLTVIFCVLGLAIVVYLIPGER